MFREGSVPLPIFDVLDARAFSSLWYWVLLGLLWTRVMHAPMGVPVEMLRAARRGGDQARADTRALAEIEARQRRAGMAALGVWRVAGWYFGLTLLAILAVQYRFEVAQAVLVIAAPLGLVRWLGGRAARRLAGIAADDDAAFFGTLVRLRRQVQTIGLVSVFFTSIFGMAHNVVTGVL